MILIFCAATFLSAGLMFVLEPMFARMVLPLLGGSPAVWNTAMVFFQAALLLGYAYTHELTRRLPAAPQRWIHLGVLLLPLLVLPVRLPNGWTPPVEHTPIPWLLALLTVAIGLPFFAASTSGPLLQRWYSVSRARGAEDPYFLFAASNLGSLLGLLSYPFLLEPRLRLRDQSQLWTIGYLALVLLTALCAWASGRAARAPVHAASAAAAEAAPAAASPAQAEQPTGPITWRRRLRWIALAFAPSSLMLGVTQHLSTDVAAIPLLWVVPLAVYLLSFVLVFAPRRMIRLAWVRRALPITVIVVLATIIFRPDHPLFLVMAIHLIGLGILATACHGALADDRPRPAQLTEFYLALAVGGALGGTFNAILAPLVFSTILEYPLAVAFAAMIAPAYRPETGTRRSLPIDLGIAAGVAALCFAFVQLTRSISEFHDIADTRLIATLLMLTLLRFTGRPLRFGLGVLGLYLVGHVEPGQGSRVLARERSFFGVHKVVADAGSGLHTLFHGTTVHGIQSVRAGHERDPLSYYHRGGPLGQVAESLAVGESRNIAVIGLGAGGLLAYARPGDRWTYYEIDPLVERIARDRSLFTYVATNPSPERIVLGDGRLSLLADSTERYDLLVLDAYSSDALPVHLLTREAIQLYMARLSPHGVLLFNIPSRHFQLGPVLQKLADDAGLICRVRDFDPLTSKQWDAGLASTEAVVIARSASDLGLLAHDPRWREASRRGDLPIWTDDYSSIVSVLVWR